MPTISPKTSIQLHRWDCPRPRKHSPESSTDTDTLIQDSNSDGLALSYQLYDDNGNTKSSPNSRRMSLTAALADCFRRISRTRSKSEHRSRLSTDITLGASKNDVPLSSYRQSIDNLNSQDSAASVTPYAQQFRFSVRRSVDIKGNHADVVRAQVLYMETLRREQGMLGITHNTDGLPIPGLASNAMTGFYFDKQPKRRSLTTILGFDKPLLAR